MSCTRCAQGVEEFVYNLLNFCIFRIKVYLKYDKAELYQHKIEKSLLKNVISTIKLF